MVLSMGGWGKTMVLSGAKPERLGYQILAFSPKNPPQAVNISYPE
jgi:hypothetical protein